jgi:hypothetical protein
MKLKTMKRISHLLKEYMKMLACPFNSGSPIDSKKMASEPEKDCLNCSKKKDSKIPASAGQRELLHHFIHFHSEN